MTPSIRSKQCEKTTELWTSGPVATTLTCGGKQVNLSGNTLYQRVADGAARQVEHVEDGRVAVSLVGHQVLEIGLPFLRHAVVGRVTGV